MRTRRTYEEYCDWCRGWMISPPSREEYERMKKLDEDGEKQAQQSQSSDGKEQQS